MPLYIGDYLSDTMHLTCEQSGAYLHLIMHYWRAGALPNNDVALAQIARLPMKAWKAHRPIIAAFFTVTPSAWQHKRIDAERKKSAEVKERYAERAKKGADKRWHKDTPSNAQSNASSIPEECNGHGNSHLQGSNEPIASTNVDVSAGPTDTPPDYEPPVTVQEIVDAWNDRMVRQGFPRVERVTGTRLKYLKARIRENTVADFQRAMDALERSSFCRGENRDGWRADFDFFVQSKSFTKLLEGSFDH
jgi:uncharacterized protein YdaU (DUF1376 family)